jgi:hypothetical protein
MLRDERFPLILMQFCVHNMQPSAQPHASVCHLDNYIGRLLNRPSIAVIQELYCAEMIQIRLDNDHLKLSLSL